MPARTGRARSGPRSAATRPAALLAALALALPLAACSDGNPGDGGSDETLNVLGAASLTEVFGTLETSFEADHDGVDVQAQFGSSTDLAGQAADEAPGDVLATADEKSMQVAEDANVTAEEPVAFATNTLVIVTAPGNPDGITGLDDLEGRTWVRCADEVPCGRVALALLQGAGVTAEPASLEEDVKSTLDKVTSGEADAGLVYASDAVAAGSDVTVVPIDGSDAALTTYFIAPLEQSEDSDLADDWVSLVTSAEGQDALTEAGFTLP